MSLSRMVRLALASKKPIPHGPVTFHPFVMRREGDAIILGNERLRRFVEVGPEGLRAIELLQEGHAWERVGALLAAETGREFDLDAFLRRLAPHGFLHTIGPLTVWDGRSGVEAAAAPPPSKTWRWMRHPVALVPAGALALAGIAMLLADPSGVPGFGSILYSRDPLATIALFILTGVALTLLHEAAHFGMARSYGVDATMRLGTRLHFLVCETDVTNAWKLPKRERGAILAAGLGFNLVALGVAQLVRRGLQPAGAAGALVDWLILLNLFQIAFQGYLFIRSDGYYLLVALGPERNLRPRAVRAVRATFARGGACPSCGGRQTRTRDGLACALCGGGRPAGRRARLALAAYGVSAVGVSAVVLAVGLWRISRGLLPFMGHLLSLIDESRRTGAWRSGGEALVLLLLLAAQLGLVAALSARNLRRWRAGRRTAGTAGD